MDDKEVCKNCNREIPSVNYVMHLAHCLRNTEICSECGEPVLVAQKAEHHRENHQTVKCELCGQEVVPAKLDTHMESSCLEKLVECNICGIEIPVRRLNGHEVYCGSRTERCESCNKYVMIKDLEKHICAGSKPHQENVTIPCELCEEQVRLSELKRHQAICPQAPTDEDVQVLDELTPNVSHERPDVNNETTDRGGEEFTDGIDEEDNSICALLPCEFCNELCPSDKLYEHQLQCNENPEIIGNDGDHDDDDDRGYRRPRSPEEPSHFDRQDPFDMMYHPFLFGCVFDSTVTHRHRQPRDINPWEMISRVRRYHYHV